MIAPKLVRLVQTHSEQLAQTLLRKLQSSPELRDYRKVPPHEFKQRVYEIYRNLEDWLLTKTQEDIEHRYTEIGARRAAQAVPLSQLIWAILAVKEHLWEFLNLEARTDRAMELFQEMELIQLADLFFDRAIYYAAMGYERACLAKAA